MTTSAPKPLGRRTALLRITPAVYANACVYWDMLEEGREPPYHEPPYHDMRTTIGIAVDLWVARSVTITKPGMYSRFLGTRHRPIYRRDLLLTHGEPTEHPNIRSPIIDNEGPISDYAFKVPGWQVCLFCDFVLVPTYHTSSGASDIVLAHTRRCALRYVIDNHRKPPEREPEEPACNKQCGMTMLIDPGDHRLDCAVTLYRSEHHHGK